MKFFSCLAAASIVLPLASALTVPEIDLSARRFGGGGFGGAGAKGGAGAAKGGKAAVRSPNVIHLLLPNPDFSLINSHLLLLLLLLLLSWVSSNSSYSPRSNSSF